MSKVRRIVEQWTGKRGRFKFANGLDDLEEALEGYGNDCHRAGKNAAQGEVRGLCATLSDDELRHALQEWGCND